MSIKPGQVQTVKLLDLGKLEYKDFSDDEPNTGLIQQCRVLTIAPDGTPWSIHCWKHTLYKLSPDVGHVAGTYELTSSWFVVPEIPDDTNIMWRVRDAHIDRNNTLWAIIHRRGAGPDETIREILKHSQTYLEAIDLPTMTVVGRTWVDGAWLRGFLPDGRIYGFIDDSAGYPRTDIWEARLHKRNP